MPVMSQYDDDDDDDDNDDCNDDDNDVDRQTGLRYLGVR
jgi:hypothetical protein